MTIRNNLNVTCKKNKNKALEKNYKFRYYGIK